MDILVLIIPDGVTAEEIAEVKEEVKMVGFTPLAIPDGWHIDGIINENGYELAKCSDEWEEQWRRRSVEKFEKRKDT